MADDDKQYEATPQRRQKALEEGQVARSQDLSSAAILLAGLLGLLWLGEDAAIRFGELLKRQLGENRSLRVDDREAFSIWLTAIQALAATSLPLLSLVAVVAGGVNIAQTGFLWLPQKVSPDFSHLDPMQNAGRIFSTKSAMRLLFGLFKIAVVAGVAMWALWGERLQLLALTDLEIPQLASYLTSITLWTGVKIAVALLILALFEYAWQWRSFELDLMMTHQEMREEIKEQMGDPQVISRRKKVQQELSKKRVKPAVQSADFVVTNPTELAVAVKYDIDKMRAPIVVAKGAGVMAQHIRRIALENSVPIVERKEIARTLYATVDVGRPIPEALYGPIADLLRYVYELKGKPLPTMRT